VQLSGGVVICELFGATQVQRRRRRPDRGGIVRALLDSHASVLSELTTAPRRLLMFVVDRRVLRAYVMLCLSVCP